MAAATLCSMGVLLSYQAVVLKKLDEGEGLTPKAVKELRRAMDLALRATFLLEAPISNDSLFGDSVTTIVEKFREAKQQSATFHRLIPRGSRETEHQPPLVELKYLTLL